jgi:hypothetical protein
MWKLCAITDNKRRYSFDPRENTNLHRSCETFGVLKKKEIKQYGEYPTQRPQETAVARGEIEFILPSPTHNPEIQSGLEQSQSGYKEAEKTATSHTPPIAVPEPAPTLELKAPPVRPTTKPPAPKPTTNPALDPRLLLPDISLATKGSYSQRLKRAQALVADTSVKATAELVVFLAAPESGIQWLAQTALEKRGGAMTLALLQSFIKTNPDSQSQQRAQTILSKMKR